MCLSGWNEKERQQYRKDTEPFIPCAVYFDQRLGTAHSKRWSKRPFSAFFVQKIDSASCLRTNQVVSRVP